MSERLNRYKYKVDSGANDWVRLVADPYIIAYDNALDEFKKYTGLQQEADRQRTEMFVLAASLVTGSILLATVASTSIRVLARKAALSMLGKQNLKMAFGWAKAAQNSEPFMFAVGKLLDEGKSKITDVAKSEIQSLIMANVNVISSSSIVQDKSLDIIIRNHVACAYKCGLAYDGSHALSAAEKDKAFAALEKAAICNPPTKTVNTAALSKKIELCMYMNLILDSDQLVTRPPQPADREGRMAAAMIGTKSPINMSPYAQNYPQNTFPRRDGLMNSSYQEVEFNRPRSLLRGQIDSVCKASIGMGFYTSAGDRGIKELKSAQDVLVRLANEKRPMGISDLRV